MGGCVLENWLPESLGTEFKGDSADLVAAIKNRDILYARAIMCTKEHDLVVELNGLRGIIPRNEAAMGIAEGKTREIAVLSRVGRKVCFVVEDVNAPEGFDVLLSRKRAQEFALERLCELQCGEVIQAIVTHLTAFGAFVDIGCGITSMIGIENISAARISTPSDRFEIGQHVYVVIRGCEGDRILISHKELLGTWKENAARFSAGETVAGIVRGVKDYGIFIELAPNLSGLAEVRPGINVGDRVSVYIKSIIPEKYKIKLVIIDSLPPAANLPLKYFITSGNVKDWKYDET